ncbi:MAG: phenylacetate--CoA ligase family protein [Candidatus Cloacimonetes bacterium]|nr:phenylacetate--CoA ligase family protein [Candidatus Cloacimonadota bacterium]
MDKIFTTAEMLLEVDRKSIEEAFACKIIDTYGCGDGMGGASQCALSQKYHINTETSIMEVLDKDLKTKTQPGDTGEIVLTSLHDYAMPLIRYAPSDQAIPSAAPCECGIKLPVLDKIVGRVSDVFYLPNGRVLNGLSIPFEGLIDKLSKFQIIHEKPHLIVIKLVVTPSFTAKDEQDIVTLLQHNAGEGIAIEVQIVDDIPLSAAGKHKYVISKVEY